MIRCSSQTVQFLATAAILVWGLVPRQLALGTPGRVRETLRCDLMSRADYDQMERGYYEQILDAGRKLGGSAAGPRQGAGPSQVCQSVDDLREFVLKPSLSVRQPVGVSWSTNDLGMRDRPYPVAKPANTIRIGLMGDSIAAGWGVGDDLGFEPTLERWFDERSRQAGGPGIEILNFAVPGRSPGQRWYHFTQVGWVTEPDLVLFEATQADVGWAVRRLRELLPRGIGWDSPLYVDILSASGVMPGETGQTYERALRPYTWELTASAYRAIAEGCSSRGVPSILAVIPRVGRTVDAADHERLLAMARDAGFSAVIDISDAFDGIDPATLTARADDYHPNDRGHALLARRLDEALWQHPLLSQLRNRKGSPGGSPVPSLPD
ncbi:SGNH/GDSL hydrolase family protein [Singulisphaera sp. Ch08]|uniref:SGNH/GDSL hydrolase family protein n=1 Tax=Singulisphaera sp. Ch08 TaxID=3120278 RepID=A0AAU7CK31_9BACT